MNEQEIISMAKGYIRLGEYTKARTILEIISQNAVAQKLINRLDTIDKRRKAGQGGYVQAPKESGCFTGIPRLALSIILICMSFWSLAIATYAFLNPETRQIAPLAALIVFACYFLILCFYYLFWRFFWWALAVVWTFGTLIFIGSLFAGIGH